MYIQDLLENMAHCSEANAINLQTAAREAVGAAIVARLDLRRDAFSKKISQVRPSVLRADPFDPSLISKNQLEECCKA